MELLTKATTSRTSLVRGDLYDCGSEPTDENRCIRLRMKPTIRTLPNADQLAHEEVTVDDIYGWFAHCGYTFSLI